VDIILDINNYIILFVLLLFVHCVFDFYLQGRFVAENKTKSFYILFTHAFIVSAGIWLSRYFWDKSQNYLWLIILTLSHGITDRWKGSHTEMEWNRRNIVDQGIHVLTIILFIIFG
jgi:hypothetical protein